MRYGYCTDLTFLDGGAESPVIFDAVANAGFDYIELPFSALSECGEIDGLKATLRDAQLPCLACNLFFPPALRLVGKDMDAKGIQAYLKRMLPFAAEMGIETLVFGNGGARRIPAGATRGATWDNLRAIAEAMEKYAEEAGVYIAVEPLNAKETDIINGYGEAVALTKGLRCVGAMVDSYHVLMERQDYSDILRYPDKLLHLHTAYSAQRLVPSPADDLRAYEAFVKAVKAAGYNDKISVEGKLRSGINDAAAVKAEVKAALQTVRLLFEGEI
jgi:sugar phosphate isomerase/epimerase